MAEPGNVPNERAERYRELADEADPDAKAKRDIKDYYELAKNWRQLAIYVEENGDNERKMDNAAAH